MGCLKTEWILKDRVWFARVDFTEGEVDISEYEVVSRLDNKSGVWYEIECLDGDRKEILGPVCGDSLFQSKGKAARKVSRLFAKLHVKASKIAQEEGG